MAQEFINNWHSVVTSDDAIVWILGDLSIEGGWQVALELVDSLRGRLRLVTGNHDRCHPGKSDFMKYLPEYQKHFEMILPWARLKYNGDNFKLSHYPFSWDTTDDRDTAYRLPASSGVLLCGHVHEAWKSKADKEAIMVNVGVDQWNFTPVDIKTLIGYIRDEYPRHPAIPKMAP